jgi:hypothetical protein
VVAASGETPTEHRRGLRGGVRVAFSPRGRIEMTGDTDLVVSIPVSVNFAADTEK